MGSNGFAIIVDEETIKKSCGISGLVGVYIVDDETASCSIFSARDSLTEILAGKSVSPAMNGHEVACVDLNTELEAIAQIVDMALEHSSSSELKKQHAVTKSQSNSFVPVSKKLDRGLKVAIFEDGVDFKIHKDLMEKVGLMEGLRVSLGQNFDHLSIMTDDKGCSISSCFDDPYWFTIDGYLNIPLGVSGYSSRWFTPEFSIQDGMIVFLKSELQCAPPDYKSPSVEHGILEFSEYKDRDVFRPAFLIGLAILVAATCAPFDYLL